jgi:hypothetical protein
MPHTAITPNICCCKPPLSVLGREYGSSNSARQPHGVGKVVCDPCLIEAGIAKGGSRPAASLCAPPQGPGTPAPVAGPVAGQPGHRDVPGAAPADADDRDDPTPFPGPRPWRPQRLAAFVFEDDPAGEGHQASSPDLPSCSAVPEDEPLQEGRLVLAHPIQDLPRGHGRVLLVYRSRDRLTPSRPGRLPLHQLIAGQVRATWSAADRASGDDVGVKVRCGAPGGAFRVLAEICFGEPGSEFSGGDVLIGGGGLTDQMLFECEGLHLGQLVGD